MDHLPDHWLLDSLFDGVLLLGGDCRVLEINRAAEELLRLPHSEARGKIVGEELSAPPAEWIRVCRRVMETGEAQPLPQAGIAPAEAEVRIFEGEAHPSPTGGVAMIFREVTAREEAEETLRLRDRAMAASSNGIILTDATQPGNPIIYVNPAFEQITGYTAQEVIGRNCRFLQGEDRDQPEIHQLRAAIREGRACDVVLRNYRKDGTLFWNDLHIAPVLDEEGRITHFVGIQQDVTERRQAEEELVQRNAELKSARDQLQGRNLELADATRAKDRFMATMSHEMRTPLNAILGYVELLEMGISGALSEMQRFQIERIRATGRQLLDLVNDVLDLTRADVARLDLELRPINLAAAIEETLILVEPQTSAKGIELQVEQLEQCPLVIADLRRLRQVLTNLLSNAVKFTDSGSILIRCETQGEEGVLVSVTDTGIGIAAEELPQIFSEFYQVDSGLTREHGGTGLGLAIARRLARLMGGEVSATSEPGVGSTFTLALRRAADLPEEDPDAGSPKEAPTSTSDVPTPKPAGKPVVVVFGESMATLDRLASELQPNVRVVGTTDVGEVSEVALRESAALVVLDVACHNGIGWEAAHALRENPRFDGIAVLLLPCLPSPSDGRLPGALDLGLVAVVPKPLSATRLRHEVQLAAGSNHPGGTGGIGGWLTREEGATPCDVLVVGDDPDARRIAARVLERAGARVRMAPDGESGLTEMRRQRPDVAVLDLMMPVLDGFGVLAAMRADPALRDIPVVVLTAKDLSDDERRFLARTAERVLQKGEHRLSDVASLILRATAPQREEAAAGEAGA
ncbi:MAG TPA: ATP-binding protein [Longimicrobiaceae bacterium]|nr:ATP-binding protein [Longimicrobiaceae bacterium]